ncbi:NAD-dependent epimerase/dehydratase [Paraphaeosphaeria sporulosa]|uniref:NAD-dependent epimerase/dehydratase n=1 Tax=Paraphaeosphaeria sporulosa TaxID=1460663 RepID=A0A177CSB9_9PLEO|nr:NAD-dependent epimerase/dehydratase [Paraphaeosphaeria sporulosa]OAG09832.1 NAD-dependent epimerase/dehydratase [Paraphaeosphaeria sporulosa]
MHVFLTGGTGFIGRALIPELLSAGHTITALCRSSTSAALLTSIGCTPHPGTLSDLPALAAGAASADAVIHLAFIHDFSDFAASAETDRRAIRALADATADTGKPLVVTSGTLLLEPGRAGHEDDRYDPSTAPFAARGESEELAKQLGGIVVRLAPVVHGEGDAQFLPRLIAAAREHGVSSFIGEGRNRWPAVHVRDAAVAYRLAIEKRVPPRSTLHVVAEGGVEVRDIAGVIGDKLGLRAESKTMKEAQGVFGWFAGVLGVDGPVESAVTRELLGWEPKEKGMLEDLRGGAYFK